MIKPSDLPVQSSPQSRSALALVRAEQHIDQALALAHASDRWPVRVTSFQGDDYDIDHDLWIEAVNIIGRIYAQQGWVVGPGPDGIRDGGILQIDHPGRD